MKTSNMRSHLWFSTVYNETNMCSVFGDIKTSNDIFDKVQDFFKRSWSIFFYTSWSIDNKSEVGLGFTFYDERRAMESWRSTTKYVIDASGYRFPLPIINLQFSFSKFDKFFKISWMCIVNWFRVLLFDVWFFLLHTVASWLLQRP